AKRRPERASARAPRAAPRFAYGDSPNYKGGSVTLSPARALLGCAFLVLLAGVALAQASDVKKYTVDVHLEPATHAATVRTTLSVWNPTAEPKRSLQFRINAKSEVRSVTAGGQPAQFDAQNDKLFTSLKVVSVTLPSPVPGHGTSDV